MTEMRVGAQLYTLRDFTKTLPDLVETCKKVAKIGYSAVQLSAIGPIDPKDVAKAVADAGLTVAATHIGWAKMLAEPDAVIAEHQLYGCTHPAIGGLPGEYLSAEGVRRFVDELATVAGKLSAAGMDFSYHNHNHELTRFGEKTWLAMLYDLAPADHLKAEIDTYWITAGGGSPATWVRRCAGREPLLHLKDMLITPQREVRMAEIGEGNLDWPAILEEARKGGVQWALVEQDNCYGRDPFESLTISYRNLQKMGLK